jgi:RNA polymerase primary sigma factor
MRAYFSDIDAKTSRLTADEEKALGTTIQTAVLVCLKAMISLIIRNRCPMHLVPDKKIRIFVTDCACEDFKILKKRLPQGIETSGYETLESLAALEALFVERYWERLTAVLTEHAGNLFLRHVSPEAKAALDRMIESNLLLAVKMAGRYTLTQHLQRGDLIQEASIGLYRAAIGFDPGRGFRFSTYATWWIRQRLQRSLLNTDTAIRLPVHMHELLGGMRRLERVATAQGKEDPRQAAAQSVAEARLRLKRPKGRLSRRAIEAAADDLLSKVGDAEQFTTAPTSLQTQISDSKSGGVTSVTFLQDIIPEPDHQAHDPVADMHLRQMITRLNIIAPRVLTEREWDILRCRFGFGDGSKQTLKTIGRKYGITRERIRQLQAEALRKLRKRLEKTGFIAA